MSKIVPSNALMQSKLELENSDLFPMVITRLNDNVTLGYDLAKRLMQSIMTGQMSEIQMASILTALRINDLSGDEIAGLSDAMLENAKTIQTPKDKPLIDVVGTGGAKFKSFNVSTVTSLILPLLGVNVAKHGNRTNTSKSGSADLLEALGVDIEMPVKRAEHCLKRTGVTFLFAPTFHPAMKYVIPVRRELKVKTFFNLLGPLTNPAGVKRQLTGIFNEKLLYPVAQSFRERKFDRVAVVYNDLGADELVQIGSNTVFEVQNNDISKYELNATDFGVPTCNIREVHNQSPRETAIRTIELLNGKMSPIADFVAINAAMALRIAGVEQNLKNGTQRVLEAIETGKGIEILQEFVKQSAGTSSGVEDIIA